MGRTAGSIGCWDVQCEELGRVISSSSVLLDEENFPWLGADAHCPLGPTQHAEVQRQSAALGPPTVGASGPPAMPTLVNASDVNASPTKTLRLLNILPGTGGRPLELATRFSAYGWNCVRQVNSDKVSGGDWAH
jgi:hypothetical protein